MPLPVFVGEHPPPGAPWAGPWEGASGTRLARLAGLESRSALFELAEGAHLVERAAEPRWALRAAAAALAQKAGSHPLVLCGGRVALAFGLDPRRRFRWRLVEVGGREVRAATIPFPSGRCPSYCRPRVRERARAFLRETLGLDVAPRFAALQAREVVLTIQDEPLMTYDEAAKLLGVTNGCLRVRVHRGQVPFVRLGPRTVRFRERDLRAWMMRVQMLPAVDPAVRARQEAAK